LFGPSSQTSPGSSVPSPQEGSTPVVPAVVASVVPTVLVLVVPSETASVALVSRPVVVG